MDKLIITPHTSCHPRLLSLHIKEGLPYRLHLDSPQEGAPDVGDVFRARVQKVSGGLASAFVELGEGRRGYVSGEGAARLRAGMEITVQIQQESVGEKLPTVSETVSLPGEWLVLSSEPGFLGFSHRASFDGPQREAIHEGLSPWLSECGFILRTAAERAPLESLLREAKELAEEWRLVSQRAEHSPAPLLIKKGQPLYREWLQGLDKSLTEVITDDAAIYESIKEYYQLRQLPGDHLRLYADPDISLNSLYNLEKALGQAREKKVWLKSGAYLVIERTEALTVIDVNSGKNEDSSPAAAERINREAAREVARQMILRNMSGIILVDFINMKKEQAKTELLDLLKELVRRDAVFTQVVDMTPLGLVEITRRRIRRPL